MKNSMILLLILRFFGTTSLCALIFVAVPYSWMNEIHQMLTLGTLPPEPIVGYLARSTSAFYAIIGGLFWVLSFDLVRYKTVIVYMGFALFLLGVVLFIVDWLEGLPLLWRFWEGPVVAGAGTAIVLLARNLATSNSSS